MKMNSLNVLIQAVEFLERREREAEQSEHGYASTARHPDYMSGGTTTIGGRPHSSSSRDGGRRGAKKSTQGNRTSHNELEKNRRAHLRNCLEILKQIVPLGTETTRHTTLGLLTKAKRFIKSLEDRERKHCTHIEQLSREQRHLKRKLEQLNEKCAVSSSFKHRSVSECSSSTISSSYSTASSSASSIPSPISENEEVDVIGYTSTQSSSDTDDHSSVQSTSSDSGVAMSTRRLTLSETMDAMDVL